MARPIIPPLPISPNDVPNDFICSVCHELPLAPVLTPCEHCFCRTCIDESLVHRSECPIDRSALEQGDINPLCGMLRRVYDQIAVKCPNEGCSWDGMIGSYAAHAGRCPHRFGADYLGSEAAAEIEDLKQENERLKRKMIESEGEVSNLQNELFSVSDSLVRFRGNIHTLTTTNDTLKKEKRDAEIMVQNLKRENDKLRKENREEKDKARGLRKLLAVELRARNAVVFDEGYSYGRKDAVALTQLICKYLEHKPAEIDSNRIFNCVRNIYNDLIKGWSDNPDHYYMDVRMLVNVCYASTWFTDNQRSNFNQWLVDQGWG